MTNNENEKKNELGQESQLYDLRKKQLECTIITTNGVPVKGFIEAYDRFVVLVRTSAGKQSLIYKHAISTILANK
ncbi:RNA chaperone Hfq [Paenibacillus apis]|uniref:RNA-binding protein Hfq n=1 Tax=Paenibacillus apis TaxID=1792174 RepID=A0A919Y7L6_9BACL|nr:RNA chaperone Hfq [Paenibacillus apis]GIO43805.1 RNA-binding protein Hfq [Paenibacillus apis]